MLLLIVETMKINGAVVITIIFMSVRYFIVANELKRGEEFSIWIIQRFLNWIFTVRASLLAR